MEVQTEFVLLICFFYAVNTLQNMMNLWRETIDRRTYVSASAVVMAKFVDQLQLKKLFRMATNAAAVNNAAPGNADNNRR